MSENRPRPAFIKHYSEIQEPDDAHYPGSDELLSIGSPFGRVFGLTRLGPDMLGRNQVGFWCQSRRRMRGRLAAALDASADGTVAPKCKSEAVDKA